MPQDHGVDNCNLRFCRNGRQLDLGESRSLTQFSQRSLQPLPCRFWAYVCSSGLGLMVTLVMVRVVVIVTVMEPKALSQVGWLAMSTSISKHRETYNLLLAKASRKSQFSFGEQLLVENSTPEAQLCQAGLSRAGSEAGDQDGFQACFQVPAGCIVDSQQ